MFKTNNIVRRVVGQKDCVPSVILYTDRQIADLKSFCFDKGWGVLLAEAMYVVAEAAEALVSSTPN